MGKAERNRARSARERIAAQQAAALKAERQRRFLIVGGSVGLVVVIVAALISWKVLSKPAKQAGHGALPAAVAAEITSVPVSTLTKVGTGGLTASSLPLKKITDKPLSSAGKPDMLYIGAEYCPYCAAMRWSMAVAMSRFGTFGPLKGIHSSSTDVYPNTPTLTFLHQGYTSRYLTFTPLEVQDINHNLLQTPTPAQQALWKKYAPPGNSYPFIDIGNRFVASTTYNPQVLQHLTWSQIATALHQPAAPVAHGVN